MSSQNPPPPELRVLCRTLASTPPAQLLTKLPVLTSLLVRSSDAFSAAAASSKPRPDASPSSQLLRKLFTHLTSLLTGRSREGRFVSAALLKAVVDLGRWNVLPDSEPWVRGLLSVLQSDPWPSRELAVVALTRIYMLLHPYQTLVREIVTPTLPTFATTCLQLVKLSPSSCRPAAPDALIETVMEALEHLIPLYPTTFRPFGSQIRSVVRLFAAPTASDGAFVPRSLQQAAGRLAVTLHQVAAKSGGSDEWALLLQTRLRELHATADQVFRAVIEPWEAADGYERAKTDPDRDPFGGSETAVDQLPPWTGLGAGAQRLTGLFGILSCCLECPTKGPVVIPVSALMRAVSRVCAIARPSPRTRSWEQSLETNPAIGREEKEELWAAIPEIHRAALHLLLALLRRLGSGMLPWVPESLDHLARVFRSGIQISAVRETGYRLLNSLLTLSGPTMSQKEVVAMEPLAAACCRDLQQQAGVRVPSTNKPVAVATTKDRRRGGAVAEADLFLAPQASTAAPTIPDLDPAHQAAANSLLPALLSSLPQAHLRPSLRALLDKTAILTGSREAMLASVLNPYRGPNGRMYPSILPFLLRQHPYDASLELLRVHLGPGCGSQGASGTLASLDSLPRQASPEMAEEEWEGDGDAMMALDPEPAPEPSATKPLGQEAAPPALLPLPSRQAAAEGDSRHNAFASQLEETAPGGAKRKQEDLQAKPAKRVELQPQAVEAAGGWPVVKTEEEQQQQQEPEEEDEASDGSVHLNMELELDLDEEGEEELGAG